MSTISILLLWSMFLVSFNIQKTIFVFAILVYNEVHWSKFIFTMKSIGQSSARNLVCPFMIVHCTAVVYSVQHGFSVKASSSPT